MCQTGYPIPPYKFPGIEIWAQEVYKDIKVLLAVSTLDKALINWIPLANQQVEG